MPTLSALTRAKSTTIRAKALRPERPDVTYDHQDSHRQNPGYWRLNLSRSSHNNALQEVTPIQQELGLIRKIAASNLAYVAALLRIHAGRVVALPGKTIAAYDHCKEVFSHDARDC